MFVQTDDAVIGCLHFPLAGGLLVGETDTEFAVAGQKRLFGRPVTGQGNPVSVCQAFNFVRSFVHAGFFHGCHQCRRVMISRHAF